MCYTEIAAQVGNSSLRSFPRRLLIYPEVLDYQRMVLIKANYILTHKPTKDHVCCVCCYGITNLFWHKHLYMVPMREDTKWHLIAFKVAQESLLHEASPQESFLGLNKKNPSLQETVVFLLRGEFKRTGRNKIYSIKKFKKLSNSSLKTCKGTEPSIGFKTTAVSTKYTNWKGQRGGGWRQGADEILQWQRVREEVVLEKRSLYRPLARMGYLRSMKQVGGKQGLLSLSPEATASLRQGGWSGDFRVLPTTKYLRYPDALAQ